MSYRETPEQRQIRLLRENIRSLENQIYTQSRHEKELADAMKVAQKLRAQENNRLQRRLQEMQADANRKQAQMSRTIRELDEQVKQRERLQNQKLEQMQRQHQAQIEQMQNDFQHEQDNLRGEIQNSRREMKEGLSRLRAETNQKLREQNEETVRMINTVSSHLTQQINQVDSRVSALAQKIAAQENQDRELAVYWMQEAARLIHQINETFHPQLISQREAARIQQGIDNAASSIQTGQYNSAISSARDAFYQALEFKEELTTAELKWNYHFNAVKTRQIQLLEALQEADHRSYEITRQGQKLMDNHGIDYWTNGQLTILHQQVEALQSKLENIDNMTTQELEVIEEQIRSLQEQLALLENAAHINFAMSISRYDMAEKIGAILGDRFAMVDADGEYFGRENNDEYHAVFENPDTGSQVVLVITPEKDEMGVVTNHVDILASHADNDPIRRQEMTLTVAGELSRNGVENCRFPCSERFGEKTDEVMARVGDIEAVANGQSAARATSTEKTSDAQRTVDQVKRRVNPV